MSDEKTTYTVDEVRTAFVAGGCWVFNRRSEMPWGCDVVSLLNERAAEKFPKPKKLREVEDHGMAFWVGSRDGEIHCRYVGSMAQESINNCNITAERIKLWADLLDRPYEDSES